MADVDRSRGERDRGPGVGDRSRRPGQAGRSSRPGEAGRSAGAARAGGGRPRGTDRAQLIIVTGLAIGVTLVALVVLLNTVIYTENLATRSADVGGQAAVEYRASAIEVAGGVMDRENFEEHGLYADVEANVTGSLSRADRFLRLQHVEGQAAAEVTAVTPVQGALVRQTDSSRRFVSSAALGGLPTWTVVSDVGNDGIRDFDVTVNRSMLDPNATDTSEAFNVSVSNGIDTWRLFVYDDGTGDVTLAVQNASQASPSLSVCSSPYGGSRVRIDLTRGTVDGVECPAIQFGKGVSGLATVEFEQGDQAGGTFNATVNTSDGVLLGGGLNVGGPSPYFVDAVYSLRFDVHYVHPRLSYRDRVRVAPGEPS